MIFNFFYKFKYFLNIFIFIMYYLIKKHIYNMNSTFDGQIS